MRKYKNIIPKKNLKVIVKRSTSMIYELVFSATGRTENVLDKKYATINMSICTKRTFHVCVK